MSTGDSRQRCGEQGGGGLRITCFCSRLGLGPGQLAPGVGARTSSDKQGLPPSCCWMWDGDPWGTGGCSVPKPGQTLGPGRGTSAGLHQRSLALTPSSERRQHRWEPGHVPERLRGRNRDASAPFCCNAACVGMGRVRAPAPLPSSKSEEGRRDKDFKRALCPWALQQWLRSLRTVHNPISPVVLGPCEDGGGSYSGGSGEEPAPLPNETRFPDDSLRVVNPEPVPGEAAPGTASPKHLSQRAQWLPVPTVAA